MELIGRQREQRLLRELVRTASLVTITGAGGVGKTALATQLIRDHEALPDGGAVMVDLSAVDHPDGMREFVASQLGSSDFSSLCRSQRCRDKLLVLDNCEHVLEAAAAAITDLQHMAAPAAIVVTSRVVLDIPGEVILPLSPLDVDTDSEINVLTGDTSDAVRLLVSRARSQGVELRPEDLPGAASICRNLDGLPLAIEIAAAHLRSRSVAELDADLQDDSHRLTRPRFRGNERHRSIREMVMWSTDLLEPDLAEFFSTVSVFAGPFTAEMASKLIGVSDDVVQYSFDELVSTSLIAADTSNATTKYRLLWPVRSVALQEAERAGQLTGLRSAWVDVIVDLVFDAIVPGNNGWTDETLNGLLSLYPDIAAALRWLHEHESNPYRSLKLMSALWGVVHQRHVTEVASLGEFAISQPGARSNRYWPNAMATVATCASLLGDHDRAALLAEDALSEARALGFAHIALVRTRALAARSTGDLHRARAFYEEAEQVANAGNHRGLGLEIQSDLGYVLARLGDVATGLAKVEKARTQAIANGASINANWALICRGLCQLKTDPSSALRTFGGALKSARDLNYLAGIATATRATAMAQIELLDYPAAAQTLVSLLRHFEERGELGDLRMALDIGGTLAEQAGHRSWPDLTVTAAGLPITSATVDAHPPLLHRAIAAQGQMMEPEVAFDRCREVTETLVARRDAADDDGATDVAPAGRLSLEGDSWRVTFAGETAWVRDSKGLRDIAMLVTAPYCEVSTFDLMGSKVLNPTSQQLIDSRTRQELEQRIRDLHDDLEESRRNNDRVRSEQLESELDQLVGYLSTALGLGGTSRKVTASAERARSAVTHRVRAQIRKLEATNPILATHFRASIRTGMYCSYQPESAVIWTVTRHDTNE